MPKKNYNSKVDRIVFVQKCIDDPKTGAETLRRLADELEANKKTSDTINTLKKVLFISETTIYRDIGIY